MIGLLSLRILKYLLIGALFFAMGFKSAWYIQSVKIEKMRLEAKKLEEALKQCEGANESNLKTISALKLEVAKANRLCSTRVKIHRQALKRLQEIDALEIDPNRGENEKDSSDPILLELNRMFTSGAYDK
jgi:predicted RNase H-like nuclease (RuvC/YqgF family)